MEWQLALLLILGSFVLLLATGLPVAFCFMLINIVGVFFLWGGVAGFHQLILSIFTSITSFALVTVVMFVLMGELLFHSGTFVKAIDVIDKWMGSLPGRLGLVALSGATLFSCLSGSSIGTTAMLGSLLTPEMERRGYAKAISIGSCMSGSLAMIIPPSALAVILATLAEISVGKLLISGVFPGLLMATSYAGYIVGRCKLQPSLAPAYVPEAIPLSQKIMDTVRNVIPFGIIIFCIIGCIIMGIATPTEASAMGAFVTLVIISFYRRLSWSTLKESVSGTLKISIMMFILLTGSTAFSQILAFTGASQGLVRSIVNLDINPFMLLIVMQTVYLVLGCFMEQVSTMMLTFPIFLPVVRALGFDMIWFGLLILINMQIGMTSPPFGFCIFVMKGVAPADTTMGDIYRAITPFILIDIAVMAVIMIFPPIATWLPSLMAK